MYTIKRFTDPIATNNLETIYPITQNLTNWYTVRPYSFYFTPRSRFNEAIEIFLPINPNNLNITTHMATNIITTLYGVIEEHSEVRYYDITIQGTTGYAPRYVTPTGVSNNASPSIFGGSSSTSQPGRSSLNNETIPSGALGGFAQKTIGQINNVINSVGQINNVINSAKKLINISDGDSSGIPIESSGYVAFHNLYRALQFYKKDLTEPGIGIPDIKNTEHPLVFKNYKDGVEYNCIPLTFVTTRSAESPMLYNYTITLRAYNLKPLGQMATELVNKEKDLQVGDANPSLAYRMRAKAMQATAVVAGIAGIGTGAGQ